MKHLLTSTLAAILLASTCAAQSAQAQTTTSIVINVTGPKSTNVNCTIPYPSGATSFTAPVASGTLVAACTVLPVGWSGSISLSGPDASFFTLSGTNILVGANPLLVRSTAVNGVDTYTLNQPIASP